MLAVLPYPKMLQPELVPIWSYGLKNKTYTYLCHLLTIQINYVYFHML